MKKLTLSMKEKDILAAKRLAKSRRTSISSMFTQLIRAMSKRDGITKSKLPPLTRSLLGIAKLPKGKSDREILEDALLEKHGLNP